MHAMQVGITLVLLIVVAASLIYSFILVLKLVKKRSDKIEIMKKTFMSTFCGWISIFLIILTWQDKSDWGITVWIGFFLLSISISGIIAGFAALSFWSWRQ